MIAINRFTTSLETAAERLYQVKITYSTSLKASYLTAHNHNPFDLMSNFYSVWIPVRNAINYVYKVHISFAFTKAVYTSTAQLKRVLTKGNLFLKNKSSSS